MSTRGRYEDLHAPVPGGRAPKPVTREAFDAWGEEIVNRLAGAIDMKLGSAADRISPNFANRVEIIVERHVSRFRPDLESMGRTVDRGLLGIERKLIEKNEELRRQRIHRWAFVALGVVAFILGMLLESRVQVLQWLWTLWLP